ncbi:MAG: ABC transporter ATP-binding protein [Anaerolineae bacterium]|nr:ABC transporter ATP-binding protein [Anaerolineae bacterium]
MTDTQPERAARLTDSYLVRMLGRFIRPYWRRVALVFALLIGVTWLSLLPPYLIQRAVDGPIRQEDISGLIPYGVLYFVVILTTFALRFSHTYLLQTVGQNALMDLRQVLFEHILKQDMRFFNLTPVGQLVSRLSNDIDALTELLSTSIVMVASNLITLVGIVVVMFALNWRLALLGLSVMPIMIMATVYFRRRIRDASANWHKIVGEYLAFLNEQFGGMLIVQLFGRQVVSHAEFEDVGHRYLNTRLNVREQYTYYATVLQLLTAVGLALVLYGGGSGVLAGWATLGMLISFVQYTQRSFDPILQLSDQFAQIQTALAAGERVARMLQVTPTINEPDKPARIEHFNGTIDFDHVQFSYEPGAPVLRDVTIHIPAGQSVAIVGATGAGKTSLVGLLARFYDVDSGCILLDGIDIRQLCQADLRRCVTVVPQNPYCFNGTIADNLRLFDPAISDAQMIEAAKTVCADGFITRLVGGYNYQLLPGGANLSQGQRQLLALARALIHSPQGILVLDEATSNIDTETEALIQEGLRRVLEQRTSIIIAHRLSTVREMDRILVLQRGQVIEDGTHDALLRHNGVYTRLYHRQFDDSLSDMEVWQQAAR